MILIDPREGSKDLLRPLRGLGAEAALRALPFGDVQFDGCGPAGRLRVGIEVKQFSELLTAVGTGRFVGHQLRGMVQQYPALLGRYLLVEGFWSANREGLLVTRRRGEWVAAGFGRRRWLYCEFVAWLNGLPLRVICTRTRGETVQTIYALARWWRKSWDQHSSLKVIYGGLKGKGTGDLDDELTPCFAPVAGVSDTRKVLAQIPGVGWEYSAAAEDAFGSLWGAAKASATAWSQVRAEGLTEDGHRRPRIGLSRARRIVAMLRTGANGEAVQGRSSPSAGAKAGKRKL